ncbi:MAG: flagellar biosynthetic protein FliO [Lachnospiraceae bacterium]
MMRSIGTAVFTLVIVIAIIYLSYICSKYIAKRGIGGRSNSTYMKVIDQLVIGQDRSIAVIQAGLNYYLIGITGAGISVLAELSAEDLVALPQDIASTTAMPKDFKEMFQRMDRFKNHKK